MSVYESKRPVPLGSVSTFRVVSFFESAVESFAAWRKARATEATLHQLSDQQLADIGLHRGEIVEVAGQLAARN